MFFFFFLGGGGGGNESAAELPHEFISEFTDRIGRGPTFGGFWSLGF